MLKIVEDVEKFDLTGTIYGDELLGGNLEDTLKGNGGADTLKGGLGDDIYQLDAQTNGGTYIEDTADNDTLIISLLGGNRIHADRHPNPPADPPTKKKEWVAFA